VLRVLLAGIFVFAGLLALVTVIMASPIGRFPWLIGPIGGVLFVVLTLAALVLFNWRPGFPRLRGTFEEQLASLESAGLLETQEFRAVRAFQIAEFEDEGPSYFIELEGGVVLFLTGQQLYEYEECTDDPELNQPRRFPCTEFTTRRHRVDRYLIDIDCRGEVLEPEVTAPPWSAEDYRRDRVPDDGAFITYRTYDDLKEERLRSGARGGTG
jgi:hypothetical protein